MWLVVTGEDGRFAVREPVIEYGVHSLIHPRGLSLNANVVENQNVRVATMFDDLSAAGAAIFVEASFYVLQEIGHAIPAYTMSSLSEFVPKYGTKEGLACTALMAVIVEATTAILIKDKIEVFKVLLGNIEGSECFVPIIAKRVYLSGEHVESSCLEVSRESIVNLVSAYEDIVVSNEVASVFIWFSDEFNPVLFIVTTYWVIGRVVPFPIIEFSPSGFRLPQAGR